MSYQERALAIIDRLKFNGYVNNRERGVLRRALLEERPTGKWIDYSEDEGYIECPFCHELTNCEGNIDELHYCWNCGAEMREEEER